MHLKYIYKPFPPCPRPASSSLRCSHYKAGKALNLAGAVEQRDGEIMESQKYWVQVLAMKKRRK